MEIGKSLTDKGIFEAQILVAADGRNSTVARLCNLLSRVGKERVALQTHIRSAARFRRSRRTSIFA